jgi:WD40 repeat protein
VKHLQRFCLLVVLLLCSYPMSVLADAVTMSIGHTGAVRVAIADPSGNYAVTGGSDGRLSVWDLEAGALYTTFQIGPNPITAIAHHPTRDEVVVFSQRGVTSGTLVAINWRTREELFRREINSIPNYLAYSPAGSYVVYALSSYRSLYFLSAEDGRELPLLNTGFGIVGFVQIAPSERNVIT